MPTILQGIFDAFDAAFQWILGLLPDSPFQMISNSEVSQFMGKLNWIIPLNQMVAEIELWLSAVAIFYLYRIVLRWSKAIQ